MRSIIQMLQEVAQPTRSPSGMLNWFNLPALLEVSDDGEDCESPNLALEIPSTKRVADGATL